MSNELYRIKNTVSNLSSNNNLDLEFKLVQQLIAQAEEYKKYLISSSKQQSRKTAITPEDLDLKMEKISEEVFLYKPVTVKNYYDGDYLERFSEVRSSNLQSSGVLDVHNKFWQAHEVLGGNVFATIPLGLVNDTQATKLQRLDWDKVEVDIYEIKAESNSQVPRHKIMGNIQKMFEKYILIREVYGNVLMVLHYKV